MEAYNENLLDKPSVIPDEPVCVVCGRWGATNEHHVIPKGMGGRKADYEKRIPRFLVCGNGNASGCHKKFHDSKLHAKWHDGWEIKETAVPTKRIDALMDGEGWKPLRGWSR